MRPGKKVFLSNPSHHIIYAHKNKRQGQRPKNQTNHYGNSEGQTVTGAIIRSRPHKTHAGKGHLFNDAIESHMLIVTRVTTIAYAFYS